MLQTVTDIIRLDCTVAALTNKVGVEAADMPPQFVMNHLESMTTHAGIVDNKVTAMGVRVTKVEASAKTSTQLGVSSEVTINGWIGAFGATFEGLIQKSVNMVSA